MVGKHRETRKRAQQKHDVGSVPLSEKRQDKACRVEQENHRHREHALEDEKMDERGALELKRLALGW